MRMHIVRGLFALGCVLIGSFGFPGGLPGLAAGAFFALVVIVLEVQLHAVPANVLMGGVAGSFLGLALAIGLGIVARGLTLPASYSGIIQGVSLLTLTYLGLAIGASKGLLGEWWIPWKQWGGAPAESADKILDTSVIIDGRVAEVAETGFLEGRLVVPQFVLNELQAIADSSDSLKRARGRRGLDILRTLQQSADLEVEVETRDYPKIAEVDLKLIELAHDRGGRVVTNDFNLAKVAQVRGVDVLNVNGLANALKPAFLPGERMSVYVVKEGKEPGQGVGYLDDGTMVVVEDAAGDRGETVALEVTSVLQTSAGKMVFGRKPAEELDSPQGREVRPEAAVRS